MDAGRRSISPALVKLAVLGSLVAACVSSAPTSPTTAPAVSLPAGAAQATPRPTLTPEPTPTSSPGPTWQVSSIPPMFSGRQSVPVALTVGDQQLVAVGGRTFRDVNAPSGGTASAWRSADGRTWEPATAGPDLAVGDRIPLSGPEAGFVDVAWGRAGFVAVGYALEPSAVVGAIWRSTDGRDWIRVASPLWALARPTAVTWNGARYVVVGVVEGKAEPRAAVWLSSDGLSWRRVADGPAFDIGGYIDTGEYHSWGGPKDVTAAESGELYAVGETCAGTSSLSDRAPCRPLVWHSADGASWTRTEPGAAAARSSLSSVATAQGRVVVVGGPQDGNVDRPARVLVGGETGWRLVELPGVPRLVRVIPWRSGFLAASIAGGQLSLWTSQAGITWTQVPDLPQPPGASSGSVDLASVNDRLVLVGWTEAEAPGGFAITWSP